MALMHRKGLSILFLTEMWERYSFYALRALLVLYLTSAMSDGGMGWSRKDAIHLVGAYLGIAYITPIIGGYFSDRFFGQRFSAMIGACMMAAGHFCMAFNEITIFYLALGLVALGNGFFKPCLTSILGQMYDDADESQRDSAYSIFYMGINVGGAMAGIISGLLMKYYSFDAAFVAAGFGMILATAIFYFGKDRYLGNAGMAPQAKKKDATSAPLTKEEISRLALIGVLFFVIVGFFIAWEQLSGSITTFIEGNVNRNIGGWEIPTPWLANINPIMIIIFAPLLGIFWEKLGEKGLDPFLGTKMGIGYLMIAVSFALLHWISTFTNPHWGWMIVNQFFVVIGELCVIPISWAAASRLAPKSYISRAMAVMLAGIGVGSYLAGYVGGWVDEIGEQALFGGLAGMTAVLGLVCFSLNSRMYRMSHGCI